MHTYRFPLLAAIVGSLLILQGCYNPARADDGYYGYSSRYDNSYTDRWRYQNPNYRYYRYLDQRRDRDNDNDQPDRWRDHDNDDHHPGRGWHHGNNNRFDYRRK